MNIPNSPKNYRWNLRVDCQNKLRHLIASGFIAREYTWNKFGVKTKSSRLRLCDNYIRFYLKYIEPKKDLIEQGLYKDVALENLPHWSIIMGFQFENLVLNNLPAIIKAEHPC